MGEQYIRQCQVKAFLCFESCEIAQRVLHFYIIAFIFARSNKYAFVYEVGFRTSQPFEGM
jgi:hypothetical protein